VGVDAEGYESVQVEQGWDMLTEMMMEKDVGKSLRVWI